MFKAKLLHSLANLKVSSSFAYALNCEVLLLVIPRITVNKISMSPV